MQKYLTLSLMFVLGLLFYLNHETKPETILIKYVKAVNNFDFKEAKKYLADNSSINKINDFSNELNALKELCSDLEINIRKIKKIKNVVEISVQEEVCDYKLIISVFYKNEFEKGFDEEIDLSKREDRFLLYINYLRDNSDELYKSTKNKVYKLIKKNKTWKILL